MYLTQTMRFIFICSGLEPGRDGVGDYIRRLAGELSRREHTVGAVAINDAVVDARCEEKQATESAPLVALRFPRSLPRHERIAQAARWIGEFKPDWVSLQFVCFGLQTKGLVSGWTPLFNKLCHTYRVHWMFHELWVGGPQWHNKLLGRLQKRGILAMYRTLEPVVTHTSNEPYARMLRRCGIQAEILPLHGNIPIATESDWRSQLNQALGISDDQRAGWLILGIFGTIQIELRTSDWFARVLDWAVANSRRVALLGIGRITSPGNILWAKLINQYADQASFYHFGEQPPAHISQYLSFIDYGIATGFASISGKSGTIAAMLEHGKEVLVPCWDLPADSDSPARGSFVHRRFGIRSLVRDSEIKFGVEDVAHQLTMALEAAKKSIS